MRDQRQILPPGLVKIQTTGKIDGDILSILTRYRKTTRKGFQKTLSRRAKEWNLPLSDTFPLFSSLYIWNDISLFSPGNPSQRTSMGVALFVSPIFWYLSFRVSAFSPCQGRDPRRKYMNMWPRASCEQDIQFRDRYQHSCLVENKGSTTNQIIPSALFLAEMSVDTHISGGSRQRLVFPVGDVLPCKQVILLETLRLTNV